MAGTLGRRIVRILLATLLVTGGVVAVTESPALAAGCTADDCVGHDPYVKGCTKGSHQTQYAVYQGQQVAVFTNWYSPNCVSNWGEGALTQAGKNLGLSVTLTIGISGVWLMCYYNRTQSDKGDKFEACELPYYNKTVNAWTDMVPGTGFICGYASVFTFDGSAYHRVALSPNACQ